REARENVILGEWELPDDCPVLAKLPYIDIQSPIPAPAEPPSPGRRSGRKRLVAAFSALLSVAGLIAMGLYFFAWSSFMSQPFFGLRKSPFNMTPDPEFLSLTQQHREALAGLTYAVLARKGFVVLTGDAGTGKTTLITRVLQHFPPTSVQTSVI